MVTQVTLGNFFQTSDGKTVLGSSGGSGLDTQTLLKALVEARSQPATNDQNQITANGKISSALGQFQTLLSSFQSASDALRNPPGVGNAASNAFQFTTASIGGAGSSYLSVTTQPGAALQSYDISDITSLASSAKQSSGTFTVASAETSVVSATPISGTSIQFVPGTITVNGQSLTFAEGDNLNIVAAKFNSVKATTGISATVIQIASGQYQLSFASTTTGSASSFDLASLATVSSDASGVLSNIGLTEEQSTGTFTVASASASVVPPAAGAVEFAAGTIHFNGADITVAGGDSLNTIAASFNAVKATTGVTAHVVQVSAGNFQLKFTGNPGAAYFDVTTATDGSGVLTDSGLVASPAAAPTPTAGTDAHFKLNGLSITRDSNNIDDVIDGVTFNLLATTSDSTKYAVSINPDTTTVQNSIVNFVNTYNALKTFAAQQTQLNSDGTYADTAVLANDLTFRTTMTDITTQITARVSGLSGSFTNLADLGITFTNQPATTDTPQVNNILTVNDGELASSLSTNFEDVHSLFGFTLSSDNPNLAVFSETNALAVSSFTLHIVPGIGSGTFRATFDSGDPVDFHVSALPGTGYTLTAPAGSVLDGLVLIYASNSSATINVTATQGVADKSYNTSNAALKANTGTLAVALKTLATSNTKLNDDITRVNLQVAQYQEQLLKQFSALEAAVSKVNTLLQTLSANSDAQLAASGH